MNRILLFLAQGFGIGRIPFAPGTFGSILGLGWFALLLLPGNFWIYLGGTILGLGASVWLCGAGEKILNQKDPGSVVMDEIAAMPVCFLGWVSIFAWKGGWMFPSYFLLHEIWPITIGVFIAFRIFDVWKPWPIRQSQSLRGGWGVTIDDALAAVCVNAIFLLLLATGIIK
jgi:phosphatidylglycerophosphatase A